MESLNLWFRKPQGLEIAAALTAELKPYRDQLQGSCLIQLGLSRYHPWINGLRYRYKWFLSLEKGARDVRVAYEDLPLDRHSVDAIPMPFVLEQVTDSQACLEEIDRVLKPMGHVILFGINPFSLWGAAFQLGKLRLMLGEQGKLHSSLRLKHQFLHRGYHQCALNTFYFIPPVKNEYILKQLSFLNPMGKMIWPFPASFYCLILQKYEPIPPRVYRQPYEAFEPV